MPKSGPTRSAAAGVLALAALVSGLAVTGPSTHGTGGRALPMVRAQPDSLTQPSGFSPAELRASYGLSSSPYAGAGQTIAIVDSFDDPNVALDLLLFDAYWGLPACGSGCFTKVDQNGGTAYPAPAALNWSLEIAMDVEWAHAVAPGARILLVEAASDGLPDLVAAEQYAGAHARYISNSWGYPEFSGEAADNAAFAHPGVSYFAAVADSPGRTQYPATAPTVVSVGGDQLTPSGAIPWVSGGGGCSSYEPAPASGVGIARSAGCADQQATPVVSADAVGIPVFDYGSGWWSTGGTSFATVLWAAAAADSGQLLTNQAISSGSVPLRPVIGGTLLRTGVGELGAIPPTTGESVLTLLPEIAALFAG